MKFLKLLFLLLTLNFASDAYAADYEIENIAVVDVKRITEESLAAKTAKEQVDKLKEKYVAEIKAREKELQQRQKELADQKQALSPDIFNKKVEEFRTKVESERTAAAKKQKVVEAAFLKSLELIRDETMKVVAEIAKEKEIDLVIPTSQLLYSKKGIDITDETLKRLNEKLSKVAINVK